MRIFEYEENQFTVIDENNFGKTLALIEKNEINLKFPLFFKGKRKEEKIPLCSGCKFPFGGKNFFFLYEEWPYKGCVTERQIYHILCVPKNLLEEYEVCKFLKI